MCTVYHGTHISWKRSFRNEQEVVNWYCLLISTKASFDTLFVTRALLKSVTRQSRERNEWTLSLIAKGFHDIRTGRQLWLARSTVIVLDLDANSPKVSLALDPFSAVHLRLQEHLKARARENVLHLLHVRVWHALKKLIPLMRVMNGSGIQISFHRGSFEIFMDYTGNDGWRRVTSKNCHLPTETSQKLR